MEFVWFLLIGLIAGWITVQILGGGLPRLVTSLFVGVLGAVLGGYIFKWLGIQIGSLLMAGVGAVVLLVVISLASDSGSSRRRGVRLAPALRAQLRSNRRIVRSR